MAPPIRVQIASGVSLARRNLWICLEKIADIEVIGESTNVADTIENYQHLQPDVVVLDSDLPGSRGCSIIADLQTVDADARTVLLVSCSRFEVELERQRTKACAVVIKPVDGDQLARAVRQAKALKVVPRSAVSCDLEPPRAERIEPYADQRPKPKPVPEPEPVTGSIMLVDDDRIFRAVTRRILDKAGHTVCAEATSCQEAWLALQTVRPDLVLLDVHLDESSGLDFLAGIRSWQMPIRVIMVSGSHDRRTVATAAGHGVQGFICKPIDRADVLRQVAAALKLDPHTPGTGR